MIPTLPLPAGVRVIEVSRRVRDALEELATMEPTRYALAHWLAGAYRRALSVAGRDPWPLTVHAPTQLEVAIERAQLAVLEACGAARTLDERFVERLPARVHVARARDESGALGFVPIDVKGATLEARALSLVVADFFMRPEAYAGDTRAA